MKFMKFLIAVLMLSAAFTVSAQTKTFKWTTEMCEFTGTYDSKKYSEKQLADTKRLLFDSDLSVDTLNATVWKFDEIAKLDVAALDANHQKVLKDLESLEYIRNEYTDAVKAARVREANEIWALASTTMRAYTQPSVIREYKGADECRTKYAEPLAAGGDSLLAAWKQVNLDSQKRNGSPERLQARFDSEMASPDRLKFALVETMAFGWWNCANATISRSNEVFSEKAESEYKKFFKTVKVNCDEP